MLHPSIIKGLSQTAGVALAKARMLSQMGGLQSFLAAHVGATAATIGVGALAGAAARAWWVKANGGSEDEMEEAAAEQVGQEVAEGIVSWINKHM